jgi:hypothetical protein
VRHDLGRFIESVYALIIIIFECVYKDPDAAIISIAGVQITERISKENKNTTRSLTFCTKALETKNGNAIEFVGSSSSISTPPMMHPSLAYCFATGDRAT